MHFRKELGLHFVYDMPELLPTFLPYLSWSIEHHSIIFPRKAHIKSAQFDTSKNFTIMKKTLVWDSFFQALKPMNSMADKLLLLALNINCSVDWWLNRKL